MSILAHTMQYISTEEVASDWFLRNYCDSDYPAYQRIYNDCFADMRQALGLRPTYCCACREELLKKAADIFVLEIGGQLIGSVAIYSGEIDDLIVAKSFRRKGYGQGLLRFAVARMQRHGVNPIILHVADWNQNAMRLYLENGFSVIKTEII